MKPHMHLLAAALIGLLPALCILSCHSEDSTQTIDVSLQKGELYQYPTVGGDEEGARILTQAGHYAISEIRRGPATNWVAVYVYQPAAEFVGSDQVELEILTHADGASPPIAKRVAIRFVVQE
ncbi:MAG TPA: hypothetical protein VGQ29_11935 [Gemmatimonadales bacterium]|jgi:hypothetical protein|nr:hypothetical protein [Gemmatimonadales bacterium]